ncbi:MAG TPA: hypothetical protein DCZ95_03915 [Verrucomicrobia bacterium]|nr:hypothetical protein [Verrucomicrobiota bacterium]
MNIHSSSDQPCEGPSGRGSFLFSIVFFWLYAVTLLFTGLGVRELWTAEDRWAEVARMMLLTGDYFHPTINGQPYFDKPLLGYWVIVGVARLLGGLNEWAVRIPSAIAGLIALGATISLGRKLWSREAALMAGWLLLTCHGFLFWARTGQADMGNLAAIILAINWYWGRRNRPTFFSAAVFYIICFAGAQMKGLAAVAVPFLAVGADLLREKRWRFVFTFRHLAALLAGLAVYVAPFVIESWTRGHYSSSGLALVFRENIQRYFNPFDHKGAFYIYLYDLPLLFLPWAPLFLLALPAGLPRLKKLDASSRWLVTAAALAFLFFSASGSRRSYYILPLLPFCSLLTARWLAGNVSPALKKIGFQIIAGVFALMALVEIVSWPIWPLVNAHLGIALPRDLLPASFAIGALALFVGIMYRFYPTPYSRLMGFRSPLAPLIMMAMLLLGGFFCRQQLSLEAFRTVRTFGRIARELKPSAKQVAFYNRTSAALAFYMNYPEPIAVLTNTADIVRFLEDSKNKNALIVSQRDFIKLAQEMPGEAQLRILLAEPVPPGQEKDFKEMLLVDYPAVQGD